MKIKALAKKFLASTTLTVKARLIGVLGLLCLLLLAGTWGALGALASANDNVREIYQDELLPLTGINDVARASQDNFISLSEAAFRSDDKAIVAQKLAEVARTEAQNIALLKKLGAASMSPAEK
jgi:methyl-accepting chemotaxis protein-1 (serine sensor receptor)